jgi:hypothetical protein
MYITAQTTTLLRPKLIIVAAPLFLPSTFSTQFLSGKNNNLVYAAIMFYLHIIIVHS